MGIYRCQNRACRRKYSLRSGTFFQSSSLAIWQQLTLIVCWWNDLGIKQAANMTGVAICTVSTYFQKISSRIVDFNCDNVDYFDSVGGEYEIDEFLIKNCKDSWHKCCWVAGIVERHSGRYLVFFCY